MRKRIFLLALLLGLMVSVNVNAQIKFGVKGGFNLSSLSIKGVDSSNKMGFYLGPTVKLSLPLTGLGLDGSVLYNQMSTDVTLSAANDYGVGQSETIKMKQIAIPVNLRYGFGLGEMVNLFFFAGPQFAFNLSDDLTSVDWQWKNAYTSVNVGVGATLLNHIQVNLNYNIGCGDVGSTGNKAGYSFHGKANSWQLGAAYYF